MSVTNFSPVVVAKKMMMDLKEDHVFAKWCDRSPEEELLRAAGNTVKFESLGDPTLEDFDFEDRNQDFPDLNTPEDAGFIMQVRRIIRFNEGIGNIDKLIADKKLMSVIREKITAGIAGKVDRYIASFATRKDTPVLYKTPVKVTEGKTTTTETNILRVIDKAAEKLYDNGVNERTPILFTVSSRFYTMTKNAYGDLDTDNSDILKLGKIGKYNDVSIQRSRNIAKSADGNTDYMLCRTKGFMGYAELVRAVIGYTPDKSVDDAVKGEVLYDAKIIRPKEGFTVAVTY